MPLDRSLVPEELHPLLPAAEEWETLEKDDQDVKLERLLQIDPPGARKLREQVEEYRATIRE